MSGSLPIQVSLPFSLFMRGRRRLRGPHQPLCDLRGDHCGHRLIRGRPHPYLVVLEADGGAHGADDRRLARRGRVNEPVPRDGMRAREGWHFN